MGTYQKDRPWLTEIADSGEILGECANCQKMMRATMSVLDDAYGVWRGVCPHCGAVNLLDPRKSSAMRGYTHNEMFLVLPTDHEVELNKWDDVKFTTECTCGKCKQKKTND